MKNPNISIIYSMIFPEEGIKHFTKDKYPLTHAAKKSKIRVNIAELVMKYGKGKPKFYLKTLAKVVSTAINVRKSYRAASNNSLNVKTLANEKLIKELVQYAKYLGALDIGFVKVNPQYIFKNSTILYDNAIVITMEMGRVAIDQAPSKETGHEVHKTYNELGIIVNKSAKFLREKGYGAQSGPALGGDVNYVLLAQEAGLGAIGAHGLLISPNVGPRQRIAAVYTSIENLPITEENEHFWVKEFCAKCRKCARVCPTNAIFEQPQNDYNDTLKYIDCTKCAVAFARQSGCSVCIKECTFNKTDYKKIKNSFKATEKTKN